MIFKKTIEEEITIWSCECGVCGSEMDHAGTHFDDDGDLQIYVTCESCKDKIELLEQEVEDLKNNLLELGEVN